MSNRERPSEDDAEVDVEIDAHLKDVKDGSGCTEIWEQLSDSRRK